MGLVFGHVFQKLQKWPNFLRYYFQRQKICINFIKNGFGYIYFGVATYILGDSFKNSSGHPAAGLPSYRKTQLVPISV
jgi:hypothetical protein